MRRYRNEAFQILCQENKNEWPHSRQRPHNHKGLYGNMEKRNRGHHGKQASIAPHHLHHNLLRVTHLTWNLLATSTRTILTTARAIWFQTLLEATKASETGQVSASLRIPTKKTHHHSLTSLKVCLEMLAPKKTNFCSTSTYNFPSLARKGWKMEEAVTKTQKVNLRLGLGPHHIEILHSKHQCAYTAHRVCVFITQRHAEWDTCITLILICNVTLLIIDDIRLKAMLESITSESSTVSLWDYLKEELTAADFETTQELKRERVANFLSVPIAFEKVRGGCLLMR